MIYIKGQGVSQEEFEYYRSIADTSFADLNAFVEKYFKYRLQHTYRVLIDRSDKDGFGGVVGDEQGILINVNLNHPWWSQSPDDKLTTEQWLQKTFRHEFAHIILQYDINPAKHGCAFIGDGSRYVLKEDLSNLLNELIIEDAAWRSIYENGIVDYTLMDRTRDGVADYYYTVIGEIPLEEFIEMHPNTPISPFVAEELYNLKGGFYNGGAKAYMQFCDEVMRGEKTKIAFKNAFGMSIEDFFAYLTNFFETNFIHPYATHTPLPGYIRSTISGSVTSVSDNSAPQYYVWACPYWATPIQYGDTCTAAVVSKSGEFIIQLKNGKYVLNLSHFSNYSAPEGYYSENSRTLFTSDRDQATIIELNNSDVKLDLITFP
jgi:hypothetical protein